MPQLCSNLLIIIIIVVVAVVVVVVVGIQPLSRSRPCMGCSTWEDDDDDDT